MYVRSEEVVSRIEEKHPGDYPFQEHVVKMPMLSILILALLAAGVPAQAATVAAPATGKSLFAGADANRDGMLSRSEIPRGWSDLRANFDA